MYVTTPKGNHELYKKGHFSSTVKRSYLYDYIDDYMYEFMYSVQISTKYLYIFKEKKKKK